MATEPQTDEVITDALRPIRERYWRDVKDYAAEIIKEHPQADNAEYEADRYDADLSYADGSAWVIYTREAYLVALVSSNADEWEHSGLDMATESEGSLDRALCITACYALAADIRDEMALLVDAS